jgi:pyruvate-ferredoxin/flavodoxin oxidoreductase
VRDRIRDKRLRVHLVDASRVARDAGLGGRVNTVLQACFFALTGLLPLDEAVGAMKDAARATYAKRGAAVVERNIAAIDAALGALHALEIPSGGRAEAAPQRIDDESPPFVRRVVAPMIGRRGDLLPVSAFPVDGTFPTGTAGTRSALSPTRSPHGCRRCASTAGSARSSARTPRSA